MDQIQELLQKEKEKYDKLKAPDEMEMRLTKALEKKKGSHRKKVAIVASLIVVFLFTYNYHILAYYGKKLLGYDEVMSQTLQDLNELGKGQEIGKTITLDNGIQLTLDGIMVDHNQLLVLFRIKDPSGKREGWDLYSSVSGLSIKGLFKEYTHRSGQGKYDEENHEIINLHSFEPLAFYEKNLTFQGYLNVEGKYEEFQIDFSLDRNKAMGHTIKQNINRTITLGNQKVYFKNIVVSETQTVVKGSLGTLLDLALEQVTGEQVRPKVEVALIANGKEVEILESSWSTSLKGMPFEFRFDTLPKNLEKLELVIKNLTIDKKIEEVIPIEQGKKKQIEVEGQKIDILNIENTMDGTTEITIESQEDVLLPGIELIADGEVIPLEKTHSEEYTKEKEGVLKKRTLSFQGTGERLQLQIHHIHYMKEYNRKVEIPVE